MVNFSIISARSQVPPAVEAFYDWVLPDGRHWAKFYRHRSGFLLRFPALADFEITADGQHVTSAPVPGVSEATVEHLYFNQVLPLALSQLGNLVFHGSAVEVIDGAIAFLAESGRGKSTLAAAFAVNGKRFLTDDKLVLECNGRRYDVRPSAPSLRLWDDSEDWLLGGSGEKAPPVAYTDKARLLAGHIIPHCDQPKKLLAAYFLGDGNAEQITILRLTEAEALIAWTKHSFLLDVEDKALIGKHFDRTAELANSLACYRLDFPRRYSLLEKVLSSIIEHVRWI